jgi:hypothetical protein
LNFAENGDVSSGEESRSCFYEMSTLVALKAHERPTFVFWLKLGELRRRSIGLSSARALPAILPGDEDGVPF